MSAWYKTKFLHDGISWTKLDILGSKNGNASDEEGEVSFIAHYIENGEKKTLQEVSNLLSKMESGITMNMGLELFLLIPTSFDKVLC